MAEDGQRVRVKTIRRGGREIHLYTGGSKYPAGTYEHAGPRGKCPVHTISWAGSNQRPKCHECGRPMKPKGAK